MVVRVATGMPRAYTSVRREVEMAPSGAFVIGRREEETPPLARRERGNNNKVQPQQPEKGALWRSVREAPPRVVANLAYIGTLFVMGFSFQNMIQ